MTALHQLSRTSSPDESMVIQKGNIVGSQRAKTHETTGMCDLLSKGVNQKRGRMVTQF